MCALCAHVCVRYVRRPVCGMPWPVFAVCAGLCAQHVPVEVQCVQRPICAACADLCVMCAPVRVRCVKLCALRAPVRVRSVHQPVRAVCAGLLEIKYELKRLKRDYLRDIGILRRLGPLADRLGRRDRPLLLRSMRVFEG